MLGVTEELYMTLTTLVKFAFKDKFNVDSILQFITKVWKNERLPIHKKGKKTDGECYICECILEKCCK